jgi:hypothetical protein
MKILVEIYNTYFLSEFLSEILWNSQSFCQSSGIFVYYSNIFILFIFISEFLSEYSEFLSESWDFCLLF